MWPSLRSRDREKTASAAPGGTSTPPPAREAQRLAAVFQLRLLDTAPEERFDRFTRLAGAALQMPVAIVSLVDDTREWLKSSHGLHGLTEIPRDNCFAIHVLASEAQPVIVRDASKDRRFTRHPLVQGPERLRFFAGQALANADGARVGVLCVMGKEPRDLSPAERRILADLAALAEQELRGLPLRDTLERLAQAERRAEEQHARFAAFMDKLPNVAFLKDAEGRTLFGNRCHQELFGVKLADVFGKRDDEWLPPEVASATMAADRHVIATGETLQLEEDIPTVLGTRHWLTFKFPVPTPSGERLLGGIAVDITEQKLVAQKLQELLALHRAILDSANIGIISTSPDGVIRSFNAAAERMLGYRAEELIGQTKPDIWHDPAELRKLADDIERETGQPVDPTGAVLRWGLRKEGSVEHRLTYIRKDGSTFQGALSITPLLSTGGEITGYLGINQDITAQQEMEAAREHAREEAEAANRAKSQFVANMSHEVRTPLNGILGVSAMLLETELYPEQRQLAEIVLTSAESLLSIVNDVLDFSKIEAGRVELEKIDFDLPGLVRSVVELQTIRANEKCLTIQTEIAPGIPECLHGDPLKLRQVLNNLLGNAIKFSTRDPIRLIVQLELSTPEEMRLCFHVMDSGIGISPEKQEQIFQPFSQGDVSTTRLYGGTGLGLSICRQLVELMGGTIGVESEPGAGSDFWFTANFERPNPADETTAAPDGDEGELPDKLRVLLAEDSAINRLVATHQLQKLGCEVEAVGNGREAVRAVEAMRFDLILMDCQMPEMDGYAATAAIRERDSRTGRHTRVIALTANAMAGERERCLEAGMDGYLSKPFRPTELRVLIAEVMRHTRIAAEEPAADEPLDSATLSALRLEAASPNGDYFGQYVEIFREDVARADHEFAGALGQVEACRRIAHRLRGASATFGANRLVALCARLESFAAAGNATEVDALVPQIQAEISRVVVLLDAECATPRE